MRATIQNSTDSAFFASWTMKLADAREYNTLERNQLIEWFLERTEELKLEEFNAQFKFRKSIAKTITGDYQEALDLINQGLPIFKENNNFLWQAACYNSAGGMIAMQGNVDQGIEYLRKAIALVPLYNQDEAFTRRSLSNHYTSLGNIFANDQQIDSALKYINKSYELAKLAGDYGSKERCFGQLNLAKIYNNSNRFKEALRLAHQANAEAKVNDYEDIKCFGLYRMALAYEGLKMYDSAYYFYNKALDQSEKHDLKHTGANILKSKAYLDLESKRFESAAQNFEKYNRLRNNQILRNQSASVDYLVERTKEAEKKQSELEKSQLQAAEKQKQRNLYVVIASILAALLLIGGFLYFWYQRKSLNQKLQAEKVEKELIKSQIRVINSQMNPHFVFNALNSVQDLIMQQDIRNSNIYLGKFADLMRQTLDYSQKDLIPLSKELDTATLYLDLEKLRFGDDFTYTIHAELNKDELEEQEIPSLLLQPYVENAIKHGLLHKKGPKKLTIDISKTDKQITIEIIDNGVGRKKSEEINERRKDGHNSFAMKANEQRLALVKESTGKDIQLTITDYEPSGTKVVFVIS